MGFGVSALQATVDRINTLRQLIAQSPLQNAFPHPAIPAVLSDLCYQAGLVSTILFNDGKKGHKESNTAYDLRSERVRIVRDLCAAAGVDPATLKDRGVRNALTHLDEYLADALRRDANVGWAIDMALERRDEFAASPGIKVGFCRCFIRSEDVLLHLDKQLSVAGLANECCAVLECVFGIAAPTLAPNQPPPSRAGSVAGQAGS